MRAGAEPVDTLQGVDGGHDYETHEGEPEPRFRHHESQQQAAEEQQRADSVQQVKACPDRHLGRREHMSDTVQAVARLLSYQQTADLASVRQM
jgi:hypothetical protein